MGLEVAAPALPMFWNVPWLAILIHGFDAVYFRKFLDLVHENSS